MRATGALLVAAVILGACAPKTTSSSEEVVRAVEMTLAAMPTGTLAPFPSALPTATPFNLAGVFCEYQFCIGHPKDMPFYDVVAKQNPGAPIASSYDDGMLAANNSGLFIELIWQNAPTGTYPQVVLELILDSRVDSRSGALGPLSVGNLGALFIDLQSSATAVLPYGGAAAWACGGRAFAWKAYTAHPRLAQSLAIEALQGFRCDS